MHCGRPVISTKVGVVPEIVEHGINGWIVDRSRSALTEAVTNIIENSDDIEKMGKEAHDAVVDRSLSDMANNYRMMFESVVAEKGV
jgi:glycosyltransferase involved in cell wall biosynthesis